LGLRPYGAPADGPETPQGLTSGNPVTAALSALGRGVKSRDFWLLAGSFYICGASTNGLIGTHLIPASMEHGIPEVTAATPGVDGAGHPRGDRGEPAGGDRCV